MKAYPKAIHSIHDLIGDLQAKGMSVSDIALAEKAIEQIGYYRLRGFAFHFFDVATGKFHSGTSFDDVLQLYYCNNSFR